MAHLVTGYAGKAHIKSADDGAFNAAFFGAEQYVLDSGNDNCFAGSIVDNNTVRILDGEGLMYGRHFRIEPNAYEDLTIETGTTGKNRIDLICMTYEKDTEDETETAYLEVIKGTEVSGTATAPAFVNGNILKGAFKNQMPLYKVTIKGVVLSNIEPMFAKLLNYEKMAEVYMQKHENLDEKYYKQFEDRIESAVDEMTEIPKNVLAQVEVNKAKLSALENLGKVIYTWEVSTRFNIYNKLNNGMGCGLYSSYGEQHGGKLLELLEDNADYIFVLRTKYVYSDFAKNYVGGTFYAGITDDKIGHCKFLLWLNDTLIGTHETTCVKFYDNTTYTFDLFMTSNPFKRSDFDKSQATLAIECDTHFYKVSTSEKFELTNDHFGSIPIEISVVKVGYDLSKIAYGEEIPGLEEGTTNYEELENKPTINGVELTGDLTTEDLKIVVEGGGASSLTDLGVEATAKELNYMTNVTSDVQEQLNGKAVSNHTHTEYAASNHTHSGYATTTTTDYLAQRITTLEGMSTPTIVYSATEPETVTENTIVYVYETE